jgi:Icc-related predicted phosphoesterase
MATTNAAVGEITSDRSLCLFDDANDLKLMLGTTDHHTATVMVVQDSPVVELRDRPAVVSVVGSESLLEFLERFAPEDGRR